MRTIERKYLTRFLLFSILLLSCNAKSQKSREEQFLESITDSINNKSEDPRWHFISGELLIEQAKYDSAIRHFTATLDLFQKTNKKIIIHTDTITPCKVFWNRAFCYDMVKKTDSAVMDFRSLLNCNPNDFAFQIAIPRIYIKYKRFAEAEQEIMRMLKKDSYNERAMVYQSILALEKGDYSSATVLINNCLKKHQGSIEALITKAKIQFILKKKDNGCKTLIQAKEKMNLAYFGGQRGYMIDFQNEIEHLSKTNCY